MLARIMTLLAFTSTLAFPQRGPGIPAPDEKNLLKVYCDYQEVAGRPDLQWMNFIPLFENMYNTNQIKDPELKKNIHCALLEFYRESDPRFAQDFSQLLPTASCS